MTPLSLLSQETRYFLAGLLFLAAMGEFALCLFRYARRRSLLSRALGWAALLLLLCLCAYLSAAAGGRLPAPFPWIAVPLLFLCAAVRTVLGLRSLYRSGRDELSGSAVKEALDNLNSGILFADGSGRIVLLNRRMGELIAALTGFYPQTLAEAEAAVTACPRLRENAPLYRLPDGRIWRFQTRSLEEPGLAGFTQATAEDVTELEETNRLLERENAALRRTIEDTRRMLDQVAERAREQETLRIKADIHNDIGKSLIALTSLMQGGMGSPEEQLRILRRAATQFAQVSPSPPATLEEVRLEAEEMQVELRLEGALPREEEPASLIAAAARECVTNCVRHAGGSRVTLRISETEGGYSVVLTNDGKPPAGPIAEGSGLNTLRRSVEAAGGEMVLRHAPGFALCLLLRRKETSE